VTLNPGVDVMITFFLRFSAIFGKKYWRFSLKPIFAKFNFDFSQKRPFFSAKLF
jgi:hypothetical protein